MSFMNLGFIRFSNSLLVQFLVKYNYCEVNLIRDMYLQVQLVSRYALSAAPVMGIPTRATDIRRLE